MERYKFGRKLGEGSYGSVRLARDRHTGELDGAIRLKVAIKRLKNPCKSVRHLVRLPEVEALRRISHPNVVECKSVVLERNGFPYLVFEFVSGGDLGALVSRTGPLPELQVIDIARQLLLAVRHMHNKGFMHRDIKPDNVLVANGTRPESSVYPHVATEPYSVTVKLADLGIARNYRDKRSRASSAKEGTRWYQAPEQLLGLQTYGPPADVWAIGATIAELVAGEPLFAGHSDKDQLRLIFAARGHPRVVGWAAGTSAVSRLDPSFPKVPASPISLLVRKISEPLSRLIGDLLSVNPSTRPSADTALQYGILNSHAAAGAVETRTGLSKPNWSFETCSVVPGATAGRESTECERTNEGLGAQRDASSVHGVAIVDGPDLGSMKGTLGRSKQNWHGGPSAIPRWSFNFPKLTWGKGNLPVLAPSRFKEKTPTVGWRKACAAGSALIRKPRHQRSSSVVGVGTKVRSFGAFEFQCVPEPGDCRHGSMNTTTALRAHPNHEHRIAPAANVVARNDAVPTPLRFAQREPAGAFDLIALAHPKLASLQKEMNSERAAPVRNPQ